MRSKLTGIGKKLHLVVRISLEKGILLLEILSAQISLIRTLTALDLVLYCFIRTMEEQIGWWEVILAWLYILIAYLDFCPSYKIIGLRFDPDSPCCTNESLR
ncbi:hypothetical protein ACFPIK_15460 [Algoriphagus aquatilis]|uniref:Uncharacterized protein n=1 Tax=Algoriphagus aquatilis TaxID=490186 RepID=A0ABW0BZR8_9BACT